MKILLSQTTLMTLASALLITVLSFAADSDGYVFPRIVAIFLLGFVLLDILTTQCQHAQREQATLRESIPFAVVLPGIATLVALLLCLEWLGFYTASGLAFFVIASLYTQEGRWHGQNIGKRLLISLAFTFTLYLLFNRALSVQTPSGLFV